MAKAALTVTADNKSKTYGDADPTLSYTADASQLKYADTSSVVSGVNLSTATGAAATAGTHAITASGGVADNYTVTTQNGTLTVAKAALTVTADNKSKTDGDADPTLTYTVDPSQLKYADTSTVVSAVSLSTATGAAATAGMHAIAASGGVADNYDIITRNGMLTVSKATLTVVADDKSKTAGEQDPVLIYTVRSGDLRYGDGPSVVQGVVLAAPSGAGLTPGHYTIAVTGGMADNYDVAGGGGSLTVKPSSDLRAENLVTTVVDAPAPARVALTPPALEVQSTLGSAVQPGILRVMDLGVTGGGSWSRPCWSRRSGWSHLPRRRRSHRQHSGL